MKDAQKIYWGLILYLTLAVMALLGASGGFLHWKCGVDSSTFRAWVAEISRVCRDAQGTPDTRAYE